MFEDSTFESQGRIRTRSKRWMVAALAFNSSILTALILIPLIHPEALSLHSLPFLMTTPEAPKAPPELIHRTSAPASASPANNILVQLQAPRLIPPQIPIAYDPGPGVRIAMDNGEQGRGDGPIGGVGDEPFHHATPTVIHPETKAIRVSSWTEEEMIVSRTIPPYPIIARTMGVQGTVVLAATISKAGTIENLRVVSGPAVLQQAALDAVKTWRYKPYMLDGQPVEVETSVEVVFRIQH
jgi:protein TonB